MVEPLSVIQLPSSFTDTPEGQFRTDRMNDFYRGYHGDVELYNDPTLMIRRQLEQRLVEVILFG